MKIQKMCTSCQRYRDVDNLTKVLRNKIYRLICSTCLAKKTISMYASKKTLGIKND